MNETRIKNIANGFAKAFGHPGERDEAIYLISSPGRVEILGNHTDHQHGFVISGAVNLDTLGAVTRNNLNQIRLYSEGYNPCMVHLSDLNPDKATYGTTRSLVRGVADGFAGQGYAIGGFDAYVTSDVLKGSGLSSSASFETWVGAAINLLFCGGAVPPVEIAKIGHYAERVHFGKPSGLQDQMACALGGILFMDFEDVENPKFEQIDELMAGYAVCIVNSGADHAGMTEHYTAITRELHQISAFFGQENLRHVEKNDLMRQLSTLRQKIGDRAVLRALHIYAENQRVLHGKAALERNDVDAFLHHVRASGKSSFMYLQNVIASGEVRHQDLAVALALAEELLAGRGAFRVQGGGFAGTIEAFVPTEMLPAFQTGMEAVFGSESCRTLSFRSAGAGLANR
jgi:galactokinase